MLGGSVRAIGLYFSDAHDALTLGTAAVLEAQQILSDLSQQHFEWLLTIQDDEVFAATGQLPPQIRSSGAGTQRLMQRLMTDACILRPFRGDRQVSQESQPEADARADPVYPYVLASIRV
ncbi:unnamed protein product [Heligmosomoides polygyrus]|uniref:Reverse transcriptase domain-containing protein n=1 Tax=Heligmosomoides polygyrus TaxID=6339 RepID=A0A183GDV5_HELPZ|nr:unnamed protein product [Heligmosomoides polygyrus]